MGEWMPGVCVSPCRQRAGKGLPEALRRVDGLPVGLGVILGGLFPPAEAEDWASAGPPEGTRFPGEYSRRKKWVL